MPACLSHHDVHDASPRFYLVFHSDAISDANSGLLLPWSNPVLNNALRVDDRHHRVPSLHLHPMIGSASPRSIAQAWRLRRSDRNSSPRHKLCLLHITFAPAANNLIEAPARAAKVEWHADCG